MTHPWPWSAPFVPDLSIDRLGNPHASFPRLDSTLSKHMDTPVREFQPSVSFDRRGDVGARRCRDFNGSSSDSRCG